SLLPIVHPWVGHPDRILPRQSPSEFPPDSALTGPTMVHRIKSGPLREPSSNDRPFRLPACFPHWYPSKCSTSSSIALPAPRPVPVFWSTLGKYDGKRDSWSQKPFG